MSSYSHYAPLTPTTCTEFIRIPINHAELYANCTQLDLPYRFTPTTIETPQECSNGAFSQYPSLDDPFSAAIITAHFILPSITDQIAPLSTHCTRHAHFNHPPGPKGHCSMCIYNNFRQPFYSLFYTTSHSPQTDLYHHFLSQYFNSPRGTPDFNIFHDKGCFVDDVTDKLTKSAITAQSTTKLLKNDSFLHTYTQQLYTSYYRPLSQYYILSQHFSHNQSQSKSIQNVSFTYSLPSSLSPHHTLTKLPPVPPHSRHPITVTGSTPLITVPAPKLNVYHTLQQTPDSKLSPYRLCFTGQFYQSLALPYAFSEPPISGQINPEISNSNSYFLLPPIPAQSKVECLGVVTSASVYDDRHVYMINDGSGDIRCVVWTSTRQVERYIAEEKQKLDFALRSRNNPPFVSKPVQIVSSENFKRLDNFHCNGHGSQNFDNHSNRSQNIPDNIDVSQKMGDIDESGTNTNDFMHDDVDTNDDTNDDGHGSDENESDNDREYIYKSSSQHHKSKNQKSQYTWSQDDDNDFDEFDKNDENYHYSSSDNSNEDNLPLDISDLFHFENNFPKSSKKHKKLSHTQPHSKTKLTSLLTTHTTLQMHTQHIAEQSLKSTIQFKALHHAAFQGAMAITLPQASVTSSEQSNFSVTHTKTRVFYPMGTVVRVNGAVNKRFDVVEVRVENIQPITTYIEDSMINIILMHRLRENMQMNRAKYNKQFKNGIYDFDDNNIDNVVTSHKDQPLLDTDNITQLSILKESLPFKLVKIRELLRPVNDLLSLSTPKNDTLHNDISYIIPHLENLNLTYINKKPLSSLVEANNKQSRMYLTVSNIIDFFKAYYATIMKTNFLIYPVQRGTLLQPISKAHAIEIHSSQCPQISTIPFTLSSLLESMDWGRVESQYTNSIDFADVSGSLYKRKQNIAISSKKNATASPVYPSRFNYEQDSLSQDSPLIFSPNLEIHPIFNSMNEKDIHTLPVGHVFQGDGKNKLKKKVAKRSLESNQSMTEELGKHSVELLKDAAIFDEVSEQEGKEARNDDIGNNSDYYQLYPTFSQYLFNTSHFSQLIQFDMVSYLKSVTTPLMPVQTTSTLPFTNKTPVSPHQNVFYHQHESSFLSTASKLLGLYIVEISSHHMIKSSLANSMNVSQPAPPLFYEALSLEAPYTLHYSAKASNLHEKSKHRNHTDSLFLPPTALYQGGKNYAQSHRLKYYHCICQYPMYSYCSSCSTCIGCGLLFDVKNMKDLSSAKHIHVTSLWIMSNLAMSVHSLRAGGDEVNNNYDGIPTKISYLHNIVQLCNNLTFSLFNPPPRPHLDPLSSSLPNKETILGTDTVHHKTILILAMYYTMMFVMQQIDAIMLDYQLSLQNNGKSNILHSATYQSRLQLCLDEIYSLQYQQYRKNKAIYPNTSEYRPSQDSQGNEKTQSLSKIPIKWFVLPSNCCFYCKISQFMVEEQKFYLIALREISKQLKQQQQQQKLANPYLHLQSQSQMDLSFGSITSTPASFHHIRAISHSSLGSSILTMIIIMLSSSFDLIKTVFTPFPKLDQPPAATPMSSLSTNKTSMSLIHQEVPSISSEYTVDIICEVAACSASDEVLISNALNNTQLTTCDPFADPSEIMTDHTNNKVKNYGDSIHDKEIVDIYHPYDDILLTRQFVANQYDQVISPQYSFLSHHTNPLFNINAIYHNIITNDKYFQLSTLSHFLSQHHHNLPIFTERATAHSLQLYTTLHQVSTFTALLGNHPFLVIVLDSLKKQSMIIEKNYGNILQFCGPSHDDSNSNHVSLEVYPHQQVSLYQRTKPRASLNRNHHSVETADDQERSVSNDVIYHTSPFYSLFRDENSKSLSDNMVNQSLSLSVLSYYISPFITPLHISYQPMMNLILTLLQQHYESFLLYFSLISPASLSTSTSTSSRQQNNQSKVQSSRNLNTTGLSALSQLQYDLLNLSTQSIDRLMNQHFRAHVLFPLYNELTSPNIQFKQSHDDFRTHLSYDLIDPLFQPVRELQSKNADNATNCLQLANNNRNSQQDRLTNSTLPTFNTCPILNSRKFFNPTSQQCSTTSSTSVIEPHNRDQSGNVRFFDELSKVVDCECLYFPFLDPLVHIPTQSLYDKCIYYYQQFILTQPRKSANCSQKSDLATIHCSTLMPQLAQPTPARLYSTHYQIFQYCLYLLKFNKDVYTFAFSRDSNRSLPPEQQQLQYYVVINPLSL